MNDRKQTLRVVDTISKLLRNKNIPFARLRSVSAVTSYVPKVLVFETQSAGELYRISNTEGSTIVDRFLVFA